MDVIIIANNQEERWDDYIRRDPIKNRMSEKAKLSMELKIGERFIDLIELVNYAHDMDFLSDRNKCLISKYDFVTLNGIFLSEYLMKNGYRVELLNDFNAHREELAVFLKEEPIAVVVSTTFINLETLKEIVPYVKQFKTKRTKIIIGGPTIYYTYKFYPQVLELYAEYLKDTFLVVEKRGESSLLRLLELLITGGENVSELYKDCYNVIEIDSSGNVARSSVKEEDYYINKNLLDWTMLPDHFLKKIVSVQTSQGCPFRCDFCAFWQLHPKPVFKKMEYVAAELKAIAGKGFINHIMVADELLNITAERVQTFCKFFIDNNIDIGWSTFLRTNVMTENIAYLLKEAGCKFVYIGFESFDDEILTKINKKETAAQHLRCIEMLKKAGIGIMGSFIFGFPGETLSSINKTVSMINRSDIDITEIYTFIYYHYAAVAEKKDEYSLKGNIYDWNHSSMKSRELYTDLLPAVIERIDNFGVYNWDNWATISLLVSHGFTIGQIKDMFAVKNRLIKMQKQLDISPGCTNPEFQQEMQQLRKIITGVKI